MARLLTMKELAEFLNFSYGRLCVLFNEDRSNLPPYVTIGRSKRWRITDVENWVSSRIENNVND
jgi:predicted DNA-binding transcriptional regulator AlpA